jgi:Fe2+ or Zn2+ uptake regulation protein
VTRSGSGRGGEAWPARLTAAGLRVTRPRLAVLAALGRLGPHRSAEEVREEVVRAGVAVSRASVFNALRDLEAAGLVMQTGHGPGAARYELVRPWHHHFVCTACGAITDVACVVGAKPCLDADIPGARIDEAVVTFRGLCAACARAGSPGA